MPTRITIGKRRVRGKTLWSVNRRENGKRKRTFFKSKLLAQAEAASLQVQVDTTGSVWVSLSHKERNDLLTAYREARERGIDLLQLVLSAKSATVEPKILSLVIDELIAVKERAGKSRDYINSLRSVFGQFVRFCDKKKFHEVGLTEVERYIESKDIASRTTLRARLSTLFRFGVRRGYRPDNPCARLETVARVKPPPTIFTPAQFKKAFAGLRNSFKANTHAAYFDYKHALAWFVLTTCCGLRPDEARKTERQHIDFKEGWVKVESQTTKVRQRRVVYPKPEAMSLLQSVIEYGQMPMNLEAKKRAQHHARAALGFKVWPKDITRHTAASYWLASDGSAAHVSEMLGNSEGVLKRDYKAVVTRVQAEEFWKTVAELASPNALQEEALDTKPGR